MRVIVSNARRGVGCDSWRPSTAAGTHQRSPTSGWEQFYWLHSPQLLGFLRADDRVNSTPRKNSQILKRIYSLLILPLSNQEMSRGIKQIRHLRGAKGNATNARRLNSRLFLIGERVNTSPSGYGDTFPGHRSEGAAAHPSASCPPSLPCVFR